jgi:hypothetical protein
MPVQTGSFMKHLLLAIFLSTACITCVKAQFACGNINFPSYGMCTGDTMKFQSTWSGTDKVISYDWSSGDGQLSNDSTPSFSYADSGHYTATLIVVSDSGCVDTMERVVQVFLKPAGYIISGPDNITPSTPRPIIYKLTAGNGADMAHSWNSLHGPSFSCNTCDSTDYTPPPDKLYDRICAVIIPFGACPAQEFCLNISLNPAGTGLHNGIAYNIFPNPSSGTFAIELPVATHYVLRVTDKTGREIQYTSVSSNPGSMKIDLQNADAGIYFLEIRNSETGNVSFTKLVKLQ